MTLTLGTRLGIYEITAPIGEGGMGQVFRARDTKLNRDVALKVLPESFANNADRIARFTREAQTLASLNHPHIAAIYGLEESGGVSALVMELVEGEDLSQRIARGAVPLDEALPIARQIAEALEAAHGQAIIHRDLKPANIKLRADGTVKVLDFGLAKAIEPAAGSSPGKSMSPTIMTPAMTQAGMILGTAAYMSPEQARGATVDKRADLWAFGVMFWEILTGKRPFEGATTSDTLAAVLKSEPDWTALPVNTPAAIRRLLRRCLEKDRNQRLADIADARLEIDEASAEPSTMAIALVDTGRRTRWTPAFGLMLSVIVAVAVTIVVLRIRSSQPVSPRGPVLRLELNLPAGVELFSGRSQAVVALSPDGTRVAFVGVLGGVRQVYVRYLDQVEASPLPGTENANGCFFSPDGTALGVLSADGGLKKVSLADGLVVALAAGADFFGGGSWGPDDRVTFGRTRTLWQVPAGGGPATQLTRLDPGEVSHLWPTVVGEGKVILFTVVTGSGRSATRIEALTLATGQRQVVVDHAALPMFAPSGHLIFFRNDALLAAAFAVDRLALTGAPIRIVEDVAVGVTGGPMVGLSNTGVLIYASSVQSTSRIVWVSSQGLEQSLIDTPRLYENPRLAPGGDRLVVTASGDLWIQDTVRGTFTRLTSNETAENSFPTWTPDGRRVIFRTQMGLRWVDADGSGRSEDIPGTTVSDYPSSVSPDGLTLAFTRIMPETSADVYVLSLSGEPQPRAIVTGPAYEGGPQFSPDGRWLAYTSDVSGATHVYVRPFPEPDRRWLVSTQGGRQPRWNLDGKELFYRDGNKMMVVDVSTRLARDLVLSPPRLLFDQRYVFGTGVATANYDVSADGQRFVMVKGESGSGRLNVVLNWFDELKARVPAK